IEADYETLNRSFKNQPSASLRLPIKSRDGRVHLMDNEKPQLDKLPKLLLHVETPSSSTEAESDTEQVAEPTLTPAQKLAQTKEALARIASSIIEDPEDEIDSLGKLREVLLHGNIREQQFALLTMTAVYKDIIPGYRIRPLTDVEKAEKVTKEIKKTRNFEQGLVNNYQQFINSLMSFCKTNRRASMAGSSHPLKRAAVIASCSLLSSAPHFNFRTELFSILVNQICRKTIDELFSKSLSTLIEIFAGDEDGDASFEAVRLLTKKMKDREYQVDESTIAAFLHLRLLRELDVRASASKVDRKAKIERKFINKRNKKLMKSQKEVEKDLREAEATVDVETRERLQSDTLKLVFAAYFRILQTGNRSVMGAALEGLARFAHLINVDFFGDLLEVLKQLLADVNDDAEKTLSTRASLLCIVTAFALQTGQSGTKETMTLDLSMFLQELYSTMLELSFNTDVEKNFREDAQMDSKQRATINVATEAEMLIRALDAVFFKQRAQSTQARLSAFVKRLSICAANFPEKSAAGSLELIKRLAARYSRLVSLYNTDDTAADGAYDGTTNSLELTNTSTTNAYELALFQRHFSPKVRTAATSLLETLRESA
ncbi:nucleolar complex-associated protein-domain-containing protein, partial [Protomyces lactucae-debilis]